MNIYTNSYIRQIQSIAVPNKYTKWYCQIVHRAQLRATTKKKANEICGYTEKHHIVPKSFKIGGEKDKANYAYLTGREHFICHWLLIKMVPTFRNQMICALHKMRCTNKHQERYSTQISGRIYESIRFEHSGILSKLKKGISNRFSENHMINFLAAVRTPMSEENKRKKSIALTGVKKSAEHNKHNSESQTGKKWINDGITETSLYPGQIMPVGFVFGRVPKLVMHCRKLALKNSQAMKK